MDWPAEHWFLIGGVALLAYAVWLMMPPAMPRTRIAGLLIALAGTVLMGIGLRALAGALDEAILFAVFATAAILCSVLMITNPKPVYSALWFALATLSVCGLFLLQYAPFLAAATVIVYAGAIVVTFVFVIMLAQQAGTTVYDQRSRQPLAATIAAFVLLAAMAGPLSDAGRLAQAEAAPATTALPALPVPPAPLAEAGRADAEANPLSRPLTDERLNSIYGLGRSLFGDYLFAVELAGTLLLIATIGAIAIAPRRRGGAL